MNRKWLNWLIELAAIFIVTIIFLVPLYFVFVNALKDPREASLLNLNWPTTVHLWDNLKEVIVARDYMLLRAFYNSTVLTVFSVSLLLVVSAMAGFVLHRRKDRLTPLAMFLVLSGLIVPPAVVPTIWVLQELGIFKTMIGITLVEVALNFPFGVLMYRAFMAGIPRDIDEAAVIDGCNGYRLFFHMILPLLKPVTVTVLIIKAINVFNDFVNPLYFFPGAKNATVQLTLYNFTSQYVSQWNLLFMNVLLITIPPLILFIFFNNKIIAGMTAGAVKG